MQRHLLMSKQLVLLNFHPTLLNPAHSQFDLAHPIQDGCVIQSLKVPCHFEIFVVAFPWCQLSCFSRDELLHPGLHWTSTKYRDIGSARSKTEAARVKAAQEAYKELQNARQEALQKKKAERERC
ncbi:Uncharacterized protein TCM_006200 [Theobroma cacao]|uniref:Uncharacterized protein n=1 Tax=Theobroma cacao TaxID=3641 RepID=A0A061E4A4_THECC|nr:Uncharacterized protein TCM_006200 [Theobroma cacao]